jgi:signal transduction histidine kinase
VTGLPIRLRLTLAFGAAMAAVLAAMSFFVYVRVGSALLASVDQPLRSQSAEAVSHAARDGEHLVDHDLAGGATLAQVLRPDGTILRSSRGNLRPLLDAKEVAALPVGRPVYRSVRLRMPEDDWRVLAVRPSPTANVVVVARSLESREESLHGLFRELLVAGPVALLLALVAGYWLASAALRPVEAMRRRAAAVTAASPTRLPVPRSRDEVSRLAATLNEMLDRLHASLEHERRFVADASHELRTPLALLRTELDLALRRRRTREELEAALRSAAAETDRLMRLAEDLLLIARGDRGTLPLRRERVEAGDLLRVVADRFAHQAEAAGAAITAEPSDVAVEADPERLQQALGNLVDNALTYGARSVRLSARREDGAVVLRVVDDGPGFPPEFLARAFDRFSRADEARSDGGSGLGLSIVALIAEAHGGTASVANRPQGGAEARVAMPGAGARDRAPALT